MLHYDLAGGGQSRAILTSFGAGVGFGSAWQKCSKEVRGGAYGALVMIWEDVNPREVTVIWGLVPLLL